MNDMNQKKRILNKEAELNQLLKEGFWSELAHLIQQWRKAIKVNISDDIFITFSVENTTTMALLATRKNESEPYLADTKIIDFNDLIEIPDGWKKMQSIPDVWSADARYNWLSEGIEFIVARCQLQGMRLHDVAKNMLVEYR